MVFLLIILVTAIKGVSALNFTFSYPETINVEEEFEVEIYAETSDIYDVKIYVHDDKKEYSEIYDGEEWRTTFNYLKEVFPLQHTFRVRTHYIGETEICVQLRKVGSSSSSKLCNNITVNESEEEEGDDEIPDEDISEDETEENETEDLPLENDKNKEEKNSSSKSDKKTEEISLDRKTASEKSYEKIVLENKADSKKESVFLTKSEKIRIYSVYFFAGLMALIAILLALRKL